MLTFTGERQVAPTIAGVRADHVARYRYAAQQLPRGLHVLDCGCGIGYGTRLLAEAGAASVLGIDIDAATIGYAREHYAHATARYLADDAMTLLAVCDGSMGAAVALESIEHVPDHTKMLASIRRVLAPGGLLVGSTPNESVRPWAASRQPFHTRHFTPAELMQALADAGFALLDMRCQRGKRRPELLPGPDGEFMIFTAQKTGTA